MSQWRPRPCQPGALRSSWSPWRPGEAAAICSARRPPASSYSQQTAREAAVPAPPPASRPLRQDCAARRAPALRLRSRRGPLAAAEATLATQRQGRRRQGLGQRPPPAAAAAVCARRSECRGRRRSGQGAGRAAAPAAAPAPSPAAGHGRTPGPVVLLRAGCSRAPCDLAGVVVQLSPCAQVVICKLAKVDDEFCRAPTISSPHPPTSVPMHDHSQSASAAG